MIPDVPKDEHQEKLGNENEEEAEEEWEWETDSDVSRGDNGERTTRPKDNENGQQQQVEMSNDNGTDQKDDGDEELQAEEEEDEEEYSYYEESEYEYEEVTEEEEENEERDGEELEYEAENAQREPPLSASPGAKVCRNNEGRPGEKEEDEEEKAENAVLNASGGDIDATSSKEQVGNGGRKRSSEENGPRKGSISEHLPLEGNVSNLDDMLTRLQKIREERKQILRDMSLLKAAFNEGEEGPSSSSSGATESSENANRGREGGEEDLSPSFTASEGPFVTGNEMLGSTTSRQSSREAGTTESPSINDNEDLEMLALRKRRQIRSQLSNEPATTADGAVSAFSCFICQVPFRRLNMGSIMHMGLEDGDPICPEALGLDEASHQRIRSIAQTSNLDIQTKYSLLQSVKLSRLSDPGEDQTDSVLGAKDILVRAESFLDEIEMKRERDKEVQEAIKAGKGHEYGLEIICDNQVGEDDDNPNEDDLWTPSDSPTTNSSADVHMSSPVGSSPKGRELTLQMPTSLLEDIKSGVELSPTITDDRSEPELSGKVIHMNLSPLVCSPDYRTLMRDISHTRRNSLKHVNTVDRSAPYIPHDIEVFCVGDLPPKRLVETTKGDVER